MRIFNFILAILFLVFAFVQVNDPDPLHWILIYGAMAVLAILAMFKIYPMKVILALLVVYVAYSTVFLDGVKEWLQQPNKMALFDDVAKMQHLYVEEAREFLGLMICIVVLVFYAIQSRRRA